MNDSRQQTTTTGETARRSTKPHELIAQAGLPDALGTLVLRTVDRTRLWRSERIDVSSELIAHFQDGLNAERSAEDLARDFGDPEQAARLIRRAKKHNRPLWWRTWRRSVQSVGVLLLAIVIIYAGIAIRYLAGSPNVTHDYVAVLNERIADVEEDDRAWPLYRSAMMSMREDERLFRIRYARPGDDEWAEFVERLGNHQDALAMIRRASRRPVLGAEYVAERDAEKRGQLSEARIPTYDPDNSMYAMFMPHLPELHLAATFLIGDAHAARMDNDSRRLIENLQAIIRISEHLREQPITICDFVAFRVLSDGMKIFGETLAESPEHFTTDDLQRFAHQLAAYSGGGRITVRLEGERMMLNDLLQRLYTDDGAGGGRVTAEGVALIEDHLPDIAADAGRVVRDLSEPLVKTELAQPVIATMLADRREMTRMKSALFGMLMRELDQPFWQRGESEFDRTVNALPKAKYLPLLKIMPVLHHFAPPSEHVTQRRDAALTAIALELYRRVHGDWPDALDVLSPRFLPEVPRDRFDGGPIKYRLVDGEPILYSVGTNRADNGGRPAKDRDGKETYDAASRFVPREQLKAIMAGDETLARRLAAHPFPDGDWILWTKVSLLPDERSDIGTPAQ